MQIVTWPVLLHMVKKAKVQWLQYFGSSSDDTNLLLFKTFV